MSVVLDQSPNAIEDYQAESCKKQPDQVWASSVLPDSHRVTIGELETQYLQIESGELLLRLVHPAKLEINHTTRTCKVVGWDVQVPIYESYTLPRMMGRRFLDLFSKAEEGRLGEEEEKIWIQILDQVDYTAFSIDRSPPQYMEGTLIRHTPVCRVEWHDGQIDNLSAQVATTISILDPGEEFGAFVKLGKNNHIQSIKQISKLAFH